MHQWTIAACLTCLIGGFLLGCILPGPADPAPAGVRAVAGAADAPAASKSGGRDDGPAPVDDGEESPAAGGDSAAVEDGGVVVPRDLLVQLSLAAGKRSAGQALFSRDGKIEEALQIVDREKAEIQTAWRSSRQKIRDLEARSSTAEDLEDGSVLITVPDLGTHLQDLGTEFSASVGKILGEERGEAFLAVKQVDQLFTSPEGDRTYKVAAEAVGDGQWRFRMTLESAAGQRVWVGAGIPEEILHLTDAARIIPSLEDPALEEEAADE